MLRPCGLQHWMLCWMDPHISLDNPVTKDIAWPSVLFILSSVEWNRHSITSGFRHEADENCALLGVYAACSGNSLPAFRGNLSDPIFKGQEFQTRAVLRHYIKFLLFRRICGPKCETGEWKSRTNRELEEMSKGENVVKWIKGQRISWLGHLERMEEDRIPKKIFTQELEGTRRRGKTQEKLERGSRKRSSSAGSEKMERVGGR